MRCTQSDVGQSEEELTPEDCARVLGPALGWASSRDDVKRLTFSLVFTVDGESARTRSADWGSPLAVAEADLTIGPDGGVADCRNVEQVVAPDAAPLSPLNPCILSVPAGRMSFGPTADATPRRGHVVIGTFVRRSGGRTP